MKFVKLSDKELQEIAKFYEGVMAMAYEGLYYREGKVIGEIIREMVPQKKDVLDKASKLIQARGWVDDITFEEDKVIVKGSIEVSQGSDAPTCHRLRGILATFYEAETGEFVDVKEIKCGSKGDEWCEFKMEERKF